MERANGWYAIGLGAVELGKNVRARWREHRTYTVTISSTDACYQDVQDWLIEHVPLDRQRALAVYTTGSLSESSYIADSPPGSTDTDLNVSYDSVREQRIDIDGHPVWVYFEKGDVSERDGCQTRMEAGRVVFRCTSTTAQQAIVKHLRGVVGTRKRAARRPKLWMLANWGHWARRSDVPARTVDSVVLRAGQIESLVDDLGAFLDAEADYVRRGIPWHRGYLFQGPPGTGKTSVAKALAHRFGLDLWYAPLGDLNKDTSLLSLLSEVHPRSVLLLEDVDVYHAATSREAETDQVSLSGLLNALDGVGTPHGLITILTSNDPTVLDQALVRPGRIDRVEDIGYVTDEQARRLFTYFYGREPREQWRVDDQTSCAALTELFKRHMDDPAAAEDALLRQRDHWTSGDTALPPLLEAVIAGSEQ